MGLTRLGNFNIAENRWMIDRAEPFKSHVIRRQSVPIQAVIIYLSAFNTQTRGPLDRLILNHLFELSIEKKQSPTQCLKTLAVNDRSTLFLPALETQNAELLTQTGKTSTAGAAAYILSRHPEAKKEDHSVHVPCPNAIQHPTQYLIK